MTYRSISRYGLSLFFVLITSLITFSQGKEKQTKWQVLENENFYIQIPENFQVHSLDDYELGRPGTSIKARRTAFRCINGTVLIVDFYIGALKNIKNVVGEPGMLKKAKGESVLGFEVTKATQSIGKNFWDWQRYTTTNSLVDVRAVSFKQKDRIVRDFLGSIRLTDRKQVVAPNLPLNTDLIKANDLEIISEVSFERLGDSEIVSSDLDRNIIIIFQPMLGTGTNVITLQDTRPLEYVRLKVLYSSSGMVTDVGVILAPTPQLANLWADRLRKTVFIPAMKDGKFVSIIVTFDFKRV